MSKIPFEYSLTKRMYPIKNRLGHYIEYCTQERWQMLLTILKFDLKAGNFNSKTLLISKNQILVKERNLHPYAQTLQQTLLIKKIRNKILLNYFWKILHKIWITKI